MRYNVTIFWSFFAALLFCAEPGWAQQADYLPGRLIIKYEDETVLGRLRAAGSDVNPGEEVRAALAPFGAGEPDPLFDGLPATGRSRSFAGKDPYDDLRRIHTVAYSADANPVYLAAKISRLPGVAYAEPHYVRSTLVVPDDPTVNTYEDYHNFYEGWDITTGSEEVVIAIVDAGVAYNHPELFDKLWVNFDEVPLTIRGTVDQDGNGRITGGEVLQYLQDNETDHNGSGSIDLRDALHPDSDFTDGIDGDNGINYIDDLFGWDFWASGNSSGSITEDNDPYMDASDHGTHVAGIAAAETDNGTGIAGAGYRTRYMAVKAGGSPDAPSSIGFGLQGIIYAAENGADVINASWGGGSFSQAEKDVIEAATEMGSVVVAAAGNEGEDTVIFPAAYSNTLAVGSVETSDAKAVFSNYGYRLDVLATGSGINSVACSDAQGPDCTLSIGPKSGTSMSTPVVAGLAGLIRAIHPGWSARRIATQIRATAADIDPANGPSLSNRLGKGRIDAFEALSNNMPGLRLLEYRFVNTEGEKLGIDEEGEIELTLANYGAGASGFTLTPLSISGSGIEFADPNISLGTLNTDDTTSVTIPIRITDGYDLANVPRIRLSFSESSTGYDDFALLHYEDILYDIMDGNNVKMSVATNGTIGFTNPLDAEGGVGFIPREQIGGTWFEGDNMLFEGGVIVEANGTIYDAVRESAGSLSRDFDPAGTFLLQQPGSTADLEGSALFTAANMAIQLRTYAFDDPDLDNVVIFRYRVQNVSSFLNLEDLYLGLFNDWDIGANPGANGSAFSAQDSILYLFDESTGSSQPVVAVSHLNALSSALSIDNSSVQGGAGFGIYDGFTDQEKMTALKAGTAVTSHSDTDVSALIASGPFTLEPGATAEIGFIYAFGGNINELRSQIIAARSRSNQIFQASDAGRITTEIEPEVTHLFQNYPNPFGSATRIRLDLAESSDVNISIYDILGRKVDEIVDGELEATIHLFEYDAGHLGSGVYFARLQAGNKIQTIKMVLVK